MRCTLLLACVLQHVAAFHMVGCSHSIHSNSDGRSVALAQMSEDSDAPAFNLAGVANQVLYGTMTLVAISGLVEKVPVILSNGASGKAFDVVVDAVVLVAAGSSFAKSFGVAGYDYSKLDGLDTASFAREAGEYALAGEVPTRSRDLDVATFAGNWRIGTLCALSWGTELHFQRIPGVVATCVGYTQGASEKPTYEQVCSGTTGHTEGIQLLYDADVISYDELCRKLLSTVDATMKNRVGNDRGTQYRHGLYPHTDAQAEVAARVVEAEQLKYTNPIVTEVKRARVFFPAENYHQRYLEKGGQSAQKNAAEKVRCYG